MSQPNKNSAPDLDTFTSFRDIADDSVFIIASGKSAKDFPIDRFSEIPMITMNGAISMFQDTDIQPFFYACSDTAFPAQQPELFAEAMRRSQRVAIWEEQLGMLSEQPAGQVMPIKKVAQPSLLSRLVRNEVGIVRSSEIWDKRKRSLGFSKDMAKGFFDARTVAYLALQIAYHAGFTKVFLVGVDLDQGAGRFYETASSIKSDCGLDQHFETRILPSLELMADKVMGDSFSVYNLSETSRIPAEVIPRVTLDQVEEMVWGVSRNAPETSPECNKT